MSMLFACKKQPETTVGMLTENIWKMTEHTISPPLGIGDGVFITDMLTQETACGRLATYEFTNEGKYIKSDGCQTAAKVYRNWEFYNNETNIIISTQTSSDTFEILELNNDILRLKQSLYNGEVVSNRTYEAQ